MVFTPQPGEQYTVRRKIFSFLGASFHVYDDEGGVVAFCRQKAFRLREDIRLYTDESKTEELLTMKTRSVLDFGATYDIALPSGEVIGSLRRKGLRSLVRDSWLIYGPDGQELATLEEESSMLAILRRVHEVFAFLSPQKFEVVSHDGQHIATLRSHFNPFVYRLGIAIHADHEELDELIVIAAGCLIAAIEGRQG
ncbi:hypothetical protein MNBD_PLANCTO03-1586 [hydrothermal vent metagenome]|uniref:LURP-one-related family protein n=1 Tax=hydrothermal vent metagenome TaxID=652676 RepID=A0A3B1DG60_9ZZZZ